MRQSAAEDVQGRKVETSGDLFGQHEGSVAIRAMRTVVPSGADEHLVFTIQTSGLGRDYVQEGSNPRLADPRQLSSALLLIRVSLALDRRCVLVRPSCCTDGRPSLLPP